MASNFMAEPGEMQGILQSTGQSPQLGKSIACVNEKRQQTVATLLKCITPSKCHKILGLDMHSESNRRRLMNLSRATLLALGSPEYVSA